MKIDRTLFWFFDGRDKIQRLHTTFYSTSVALNNFMNTEYSGKRIKFINIELSTEKTYEIFPDVPKEEHYYFGGHLTIYGLIDLEAFLNLSRQEQVAWLWQKGREYLMTAGEKMKNQALVEAVDLAYQKAAQAGFNPDYRVLSETVQLGGQELGASLWMRFDENFTYSVFTLEKGNEIVFSKEIDKCRIGNGFFLVMYKSIVQKEESVIIKGAKDVDYLPLKLTMEDFGAAIAE